MAAGRFWPHHRHLLINAGRVAMKSLRWRCCYLSFCCLCAISFSSAQHSEQDKLTRFLQGMESFSADFDQVLLNEHNEPLEMSSGQVKLIRDGRFYWHYTTPYSQKIISDGDLLWVYDEDLQQVTVSRLNTAIANTPLRILSSQLDVSEYYDLTVLPLTAGIDIIELRPHDTDSPYSLIRFTLDGTTLLSMTLQDALGYTTNIEFSHTARNPVLDAALFNFSVPDGIDVIDHRALDTDPENAAGPPP